MLETQPDLSDKMIPFNKPYFSGKELEYMSLAIQNGRTSGNQEYSKKIDKFFCEQYGFKQALFTTSCTDALEMCSILLDIRPGDEVILPSYTFVSTANPFVMRGAKLVFADSCSSQPNIDHSKLESLITSKTKAIIVVHYGGVACEMDTIVDLCKKHELYLVEDAAQAIDSFYKGKPLGSFGDLSTFSFHETKNLSCGEGGLLAINNEEFTSRAEIIWEKGTNRSSFFRGEIDKYGWVDVGSSFLASDLLGGYLYAQIENLKDIQQKRISIWKKYYELLKSGEGKGWYRLPDIPSYATINGHLFYLVCNSVDERGALISYLRERSIHAVFHYLSLHKSDFYEDKHDGRVLANSDKFTHRLVRLPLFYELTEEQIEYICNTICQFFESKND